MRAVGDGIAHQSPTGTAHPQCQDRRSALLTFAGDLSPRLYMAKRDADAHQSPNSTASRGLIALTAHFRQYRQSEVSAALLREY